MGKQQSTSNGNETNDGAGGSSGLKSPMGSKNAQQQKTRSTQPLSRLKKGNNGGPYSTGNGGSNHGGFRGRHNSWPSRPAAGNNIAPVNNQPEARYGKYDPAKDIQPPISTMCSYRQPTKPIVSWVPSSEGRVQPGAIAAGRERNNPYTFIGRVTLKNERYHLIYWNATAKHYCYLSCVSDYICLITFTFAGALAELCHCQDVAILYRREWNTNVLRMKFLSTCHQGGWYGDVIMVDMFQIQQYKWELQ